MSTLPSILIVAGSDPSSGAGLQLDIRVAVHRGCYPFAVPALLTVQNSQGIRKVALCEPSLVQEQIACLLDDVTPAAVKLGALGSIAHARSILAALERVEAPIVFDPILRSSSNAPLFSDDPRLLLEQLTAKIEVCTPNISEAEQLLGSSVTAGNLMAAARELATRLQCTVLLKGGHLETEDVLHAVVTNDGQEEIIRSPRLGLRLHGTGCALSTALACELAKSADARSAVTTAIAWMQTAVQQSRQLGKDAALHAFDL